MNLNDRPEGSVPWPHLKSFFENLLSCYGLEVRSELPARWRIKVGRYRYSEEWLRCYAISRHFTYCTVIASDYANKRTGLERPIVEDRELDLKLLWAHAKMLRQAKQTVHVKQPSLR